MKILAIETSCDDTCVAIVETKSKQGGIVPYFRILSNIVSSQTKIHQKYGGVVPGLAKREHQKNLIPVFKEALRGAEALNAKCQITNVKLSSKSKIQTLEKILDREPVLLEMFKKSILSLAIPKIDFIAVTHGPGLEPALWAGINFARTLSYWWNVPLLGVDHMRGHIAANFLQEVGGDSKSEARNPKIDFPAICLAVSGGHTQLILVKDINKYKLLGETLDDAAGEAFDKVARMLGLGFPGGPKIAKLAECGKPEAFDFPRPMLHTKDYNFSFSGLKTAVLYTLKKPSGSDPDGFGVRPQRIRIKTKRDIAASFQQAVIDVLIAKTIKSAKEYNAKTIMLAGGVTANKELRKQFGKKIKTDMPNATYRTPDTKFATDNAAMIAAAAYFNRNRAALTRWKTLKADGNLKIKS